MSAPRALLLTIDAAVNALLGGLLLLAPGPTIRVLGLPATDALFYVSVLGAVLLGIAVALWIERRGRGTGLGLHGAIVINVFGAGTVLVWLVSGALEIPTRGSIVLGAVAAVVLALALAELASLVRKRGA